MHAVPLQEAAAPRRQDVAETDGGGRWGMSGKKAAALTRGGRGGGGLLPPFPGLELQPRVGPDGAGLICAPLMSSKVSGSSTGGEFQ